ncbi:MAG: hypothetical protein K2P85_02115 [Flavobacteriaceae bacterium]|nr:hypothetical protein [Flavobacteriaceae bacterium]
MNKQNILSFFLFTVSFFLFVSCDNEPLDPVLAAQITTPTGGGGTGTGGGGTGGGGTGGGTSSGDYWPAALNNQWTMSQNGVTQQPMKMISVNSIGGLTYYTFNQTTGTGGGSGASGITRLRKSSGNYYLKVEDLTINAGTFTGVQTGYEMLLLKDYLTPGNTWTGSYNQTTTYNDPIIPVISMNTNYTGTILSVGNTETVDGEVYPNVIKMTIHQVTSMTGLPNTIADTEYWFAKDVGPIKSTTTSGGSTFSNILIDYILN